MNVLSIENISRTLGERVLFEDISFGLNFGEKVALIGRNGTGKSTLLKIIAGIDQPDGGKVTFRNDAKVGYLRQQERFEPGQSLMDALFGGDDEVFSLIRHYNKVIQSSDRADELEQAAIAMEKLSAWETERRCIEIAGRLGLHDLTKSVSSCSGGQIKRLSLARLLGKAPDILLLDEITNHLDIDMIEWLEGYLSRYHGSILMVTHDRYFLESVCSGIYELDNKKLHYYPGNYEVYLTRKAEREQQLASTIQKAKNLYKTELEWLRRMPKARGTKSKSRIAAAKDLEATAKQRIQNKEADFNIKMERLGTKIAELKNISKSYGSKEILKGFSYTFRKAERVGIVGANGAGKTTFLDLLTGKIQPDSGTISLGETVVPGYYTQHGIAMDETKRVIEWLRDEIADVIKDGDGRQLSAKQYLELFLFDHDKQHGFISKLSGGEKRRLNLLHVLIRNPNFLILDEPTNDLDLQTLAVLEQFLFQFPGCLVIVTHDRYFLDRLADHLFILSGDASVKDFPGNYSQWLESEEAQAKSAKATELSETPASKTTQPKTSAKNKLSFKEKFELDQLEKEIAELQFLKDKISEELSNPDPQNTSFASLGTRLEQVSNDLDFKELRWLELSEKKEQF